jgi:predicted phage terminase large subunit-like protein
MMETLELNQLQDKVFTDKTIRAELTTQSHQWFFSTYFSAYITHETADLHRDLFAISEDENLPLAVIVAFRGSGKSTIMTLSYPIWAVLGRMQKKFVLIASQTQYQARVHLTNIKRELESNELLANDLGPFVEQREEWGSTSLYIPKYNARITAISTEQSVRGIRHGQYRPDLIICDDVEDMTSTKTREGRNKTFDWFTGEIIPAGDTYTKRIVVGNLLHEDSLLMRLKERIENDQVDGIFREWPIVKGNKSLWPGKYPDKKSLNVLRRTVGNKIAWEREYMLRIIPDEDQIIDARWIQYYDELPEKTEENQYVNSFVSVDLAISEKATADCTAVVIVHVFGYKPEDRKYYIDKRFLNERISHMHTLDSITSIYRSLEPRNDESEEVPRALIEQVAYQTAALEQLKHRGIEAVGVKIHADKRARLQLASPLFEMGMVYFPKDRSIAPIIQQLVGFGVEKHDDLADAVSMALNYIQTKVKWEVVFAFGFIGEGPGQDTHEQFYGIRYADN